MPQKPIDDWQDIGLDDWQEQPKEESNSWYDNILTVPNAIRFGGSALGAVGAGLSASTGLGAVASPALLFGGGALGEAGARWWEGKDFDPTITALEGGLNLLPGGGAIPGKGAALKEIGKYGLRAAGHGAWQGAVGSLPRHQAEKGTLWQPENWEMPSAGEIGSQTVAGGLIGGTVGTALGAGNVKYQNRNIGHSASAPLNTVAPDKHPPPSFGQDTPPPVQGPDIGPYGLPNPNQRELPLGIDFPLNEPTQRRLPIRQPKKTDPYDFINDVESKYPYEPPPPPPSGEIQPGLDFGEGLFDSANPVPGIEQTPYKPPTNTVSSGSEGVNIGLTGPNIIPDGSTISDNHQIVTITAPDAGLTKFWRDKGYVSVPGLVDSQGRIQMVRGDIAPLYLKGDKTPPPAPQPNAFEKAMRAKSSGTMAGALAPDALVGGDTVTIPNEKLTKPFLEGMAENYKLQERGPTHSIFKRFIKEDAGTFTPVEMWENLKRLLGRDPTPEEVDASMGRQVQPGESTGRVAPFLTQEQRAERLNDLSNDPYGPKPEVPPQDKWDQMAGEYDNQITTRGGQESRNMMEGIEREIQAENQPPSNVTPFPTEERARFQDIANRDNVTMDGVRPQRGVPITHPEGIGGFQEHVRGNEIWITHPMFPEPQGPFPNSEVAGDWIMRVQDSPEFDAYLADYNQRTALSGVPEEGGLDVAGIRQRNVMDPRMRERVEAGGPRMFDFTPPEAGQMELPLVRGVPDTGTPVDADMRTRELYEAADRFKRPYVQEPEQLSMEGQMKDAEIQAYLEREDVVTPEMRDLNEYRNEGRRETFNRPPSNTSNDFNPESLRAYLRNKFGREPTDTELVQYMQRQSVSDESPIPAPPKQLSPMDEIRQRLERDMENPPPPRARTLDDAANDLADWAESSPQDSATGKALAQEIIDKIESATDTQTALKNLGEIRAYVDTVLDAEQKAIFEALYQRAFNKYHETIRGGQSQSVEFQPLMGYDLSNVPPEAFNTPRNPALEDVHRVARELGIDPEQFPKPDPYGPNPLVDAIKKAGGRYNEQTGKWESAGQRAGETLEQRNARFAEDNKKIQDKSEFNKLSNPLWREVIANREGKVTEEGLNKAREVINSADQKTSESQIEALDDWMEEAAREGDFRDAEWLGALRKEALDRLRKLIGPEGMFKRFLEEDQGAVPIEDILESWRKMGRGAVRIVKILRDGTARNLATDVEKLDAANAPDAKYRDLVPTATKLKKDETWRSRVIDTIKFFESKVRDITSVDYNPMADLFKNGLRAVDDFKKARFILPDGTKVTHDREIHEFAARDLGTTLEDALENGIIRYDAGGNVEIGSKITSAQAKALVESRVMRGLDGFYVDVLIRNESAPYGVDRKFRKVDERVNASALRTWVNGQFPDLLDEFIRGDQGATPLKDIMGMGRKVKEFTGIGMGGKNKKNANEYSFIKEALALPTNATTVLDLSAPGRQGLSMILTPEFWRAAGAMFKGLSNEGFKQIDAELNRKPIMQRPIDPVTGKEGPSFAQQIGSKYFSPASKPGVRAEATASKWLESGAFLGGEKIPFTGVKNPLALAWKHSVGYPIRASNRAFTTFLNHLNVNRTEKLLNLGRNMAIRGEQTGRTAMPGMLGGIHLPTDVGIPFTNKRISTGFAPGSNIGLTQKVTPEQAMEMNPYTNLVLAKEIAEFVNAATGHATAKGGLSLENAVSKIGPFLFSPGLLNSRIRMMNPVTYATATPFVRKQYAKAAVSTAAAWFVATELIKNAAGEDAEVSDDITSADFGKVRVGDARLDLGGGFLQFAVAYGRMYKGGSTSSSSGEFHRFGSGYQAQTQEDMMERFMVNKLNPVSKFAWDVYSASEYNAFHVGDRTAQLFVPLFIQDLNEIAKEDPDLLPLFGTASMFGGGTQIYSKGESVSKLIPEENDWLVTGGGLRDLMPWNQSGEEPRNFPWSER